ncbi:hypothetical protein IMSAGC019_03643 [Lachnospiraceae bacterium]|nr:hypothetical protein IMSAGC019_03643 [Lachnospiraceae bacterium]
MAYRGNQRLNAEIERQIAAWDGTVHGQAIKNMYENGSEYESICELMGLDYEDYEEECRA